jgi:hypothetical protein
MTAKPKQMTDYTKLSGAEFQRAVGADPEKWAEAFMQQDCLSGRDIDVIAGWFRDAMEAAVKAAHSGDWRQLLSE